jgi:hypothetical protein
MEESEHRIELAVRSDSPEERQLAHRILDDEKRHRAWEAAHYRLMKSIAEVPTPRGQITRLRQVTSSLTNAQALFRYLRDNRVTGSRRRALFSVFYGPADYVSAVLKEHDRFLAAASSSLCNAHLGVAIWHDPCFQDPLVDYEEAYFSYFSVYCDCAIAEHECREPSTRSLLLLLKDQAMRKRANLLAAPCELDDSRRIRRSRRERRFGIAGLRLTDTHL